MIQSSDPNNKDGRHTCFHSLTWIVGFVFCCCFFFCSFLRYVQPFKIIPAFSSFFFNGLVNIKLERTRLIFDNSQILILILFFNHLFPEGPGSLYVFGQNTGVRFRQRLLYHFWPHYTHNAIALNARRLFP